MLIAPALSILYSMPHLLCIYYIDNAESISQNRLYRQELSRFIVIHSRSYKIWHGSGARKWSSSVIFVIISRSYCILNIIIFMIHIFKKTGKGQDKLWIFQKKIFAINLLFFIFSFSYLSMNQIIVFYIKFWSWLVLLGRCYHVLPINRETELINSFSSKRFHFFFCFK